MNNSNAVYADFSQDDDYLYNNPELDYVEQLEHEFKLSTPAEQREIDAAYHQACLDAADEYVDYRSL